MPGGLAQGLGDSGVVLRWGCGEGVRKLRPKRLKQQFGFAGRLGWDRGLGWDGRGCFLTQATPSPRRSLQHPNVLQCLGVCVETLPFLLIMEFCQLVRVWGRGGRAGSWAG